MIMKRATAFVLLAFCGFLAVFATISPAFAKTGDTTRVAVFDKYLWTYYGTQERWAKFPEPGKKFEKVLMRYKLTCPTGGCGEWDYTTKVIIRHRTGLIDSVLKDAPSFTVNGATYDSIRLAMDTTRSTSYNSSKKRTDTTVNQPYKIYLYKDLTNPFTPTDSLIAWKAGYWNYKYDNTGKAIDSAYIAGDTTYHVTKTQAYYKFDQIIPYEIGRYITPYGKWFPKDWSYVWTFDVTDFAFLLHDSVEIQTLYSGYSQGSLYSLDFDFIEGTPRAEAYKAEILYNGYFPYGNPNDPIEKYLPEKKVQIDPNADLTILRVLTSGHGFGGTDNAAEFAERTHSILINGEKKFEQHLWRSDCGQNPVYPQAGTWYYQRAGWCPGDKVSEFDFNITPFGNKGDSVAINYDMEPYTNQDLSHPAGYDVFVAVLSYKGINFANDAALMEIKQPNNAVQYKRMNPICSNASPQIVIRNQGKNNLTKVTVRYFVDNGTPKDFEWTGNLAYMQSADVTLPATDLGEGNHQFTVALVSPNGGADDQPVNNMMTVSYQTPKLFSNKIMISVRTDKIPEEYGIPNDIRYEIIDQDGNKKLERLNLDDATTYRDTLILPGGCYQFKIYDEGMGDGLYPIVQGSSPGNYLIKDEKNQTIVSATSTNHMASFGDREITTFSIAPLNAVHPLKKNRTSIDISPNPTRGGITVSLKEFGTNKATIRVFNILGKEVLEEKLHAGEPNVKLSLGSLPKGTYIVRVESEELVASKRIVLMK